jgi:membrane protease YdiL (CAAX protease family)
MKILAKISPYLMPFVIMLFGLYWFENVWIAMLGYHLLAGLILLRNRQFHRVQQLWEGGGMLLSLVCMVLGATAGWLIYLSVGFIHLPPNLAESLQAFGLSNGSWWFFILHYAIVNPVIEELYWRGFLGSESRLPTLSDICYAAYHPLVLAKFIAWQWTLPVLIGLVAMGWRWLSAYSKGLRLATLMHASADLSIILAIYNLAHQSF